MKTYIEIIRHKDDKCIHRIDVSGISQRHIDKTERGMNRNLNHEEYFTKEVSSKKQLPIL